MTNLECLAKDLHLEPEVLLRASLETFLKRKLKVIESELFLLSRKYGVRSVVEFDNMGLPT